MSKRKECPGDRAGRGNPESPVQDLAVNDIREFDVILTVHRR